MALVLTGYSSYAVAVPDASGRPAPVRVHRGQSVDGLGLTEAQLRHLKSLTVGRGRTKRPVFTEVASTPVKRPTGDAASSKQLVEIEVQQRRAAEAAPEAPKEEPAAETKPAPVKRAPAKRTTKKRATRKKAAPKRSTAKKAAPKKEDAKDDK